MTDIYEQHHAAFNSVEAYVICKGSDRVASVAFKFPADGAGRLYAYVHWFGLEMVRGYASGGGYDKRSAACASAMRAAGFARRAPGYPIDPNPAIFADALLLDGSKSWDIVLRDAGFQVFQAV